MSVTNEQACARRKGLARGTRSTTTTKEQRSWFFEIFRPKIGRKMFILFLERSLN